MTSPTIPADETVVPATGHYYFKEWTAGVTGPVVPPTDWNDVESDTNWTDSDLGSTSLDSPFGISSDGGDATTLGTWQNKSKRQSFADRTETVAFALEDWNTKNYRLYWGANSTVGTDGLVATPANPVPVEGTLVMVASDGANKIPFYFPHVSIYRADDIAFDPEALAGMPVAATVLGVDGQDWLYKVGEKAIYPSGA